MCARMTLRTLDARLNDVERKLEVVKEGLSRLADGSSADDDLSYPEPVAYSLGRERASSLYHERFLNLLDAGEATIIYTAAFALALLSGTEEHQQLVQPLRNRPIALGTWASVIEQSLNSMLAAEGSTVSVLASCLLAGFRRANGRPTSAARFLLEELVTIRNEVRGHGAARTEGMYEDLYRRYASGVHDSLRSLAFLKLPLVRVEDIDVAGEHMHYGVRVLMGPVARIERFMSSVRMPRGATCVWDKGEVLVSLGDIVRYQSCPACNFDHTFFLDQATSKMAKYKAYAGSHGFQAPPVSWACQ